MHIRGPQPQTIERQVGVAECLHEMAEMVTRIVAEQRQLLFAKGLGVTIEPRRICIEDGVRFNLADIGTLEHIARILLMAVTGRALGMYTRRPAATFAGSGRNGLGSGCKC